MLTSMIDKHMCSSTKLCNLDYRVTYSESLVNKGQNMLLKLSVDANNIAISYW